MSYQGPLPSAAPGHPPFPVKNVGNSRPQDPLGREYSGSQVDRGTSHIFYKTRLCLRFSSGNCSNGESCTFAHGIAEMRDPPPNWQEYAKPKGKEAGYGDNDQRSIRAQKVCRRYFYERECPYGDKCSFRHETPGNTEIARPCPIGSSSPSIGTTGPVLKQISDPGQTVVNKHANVFSDAVVVSRKPAWFKTKICTRWETTGQCRFMENCYYAHGHSELVGAGVTSNSSVPSKDAHLLIDDSGTSSGVATQVSNTKMPNLWHPGKKIIGIYADWPEDMELPEEERIRQSQLEP